MATQANQRKNKPIAIIFLSHEALKIYFMALSH